MIGLEDKIIFAQINHANIFQGAGIVFAGMDTLHEQAESEL